MQGDPAAIGHRACWRGRASTTASVASPSKAPASSADLRGVTQVPGLYFLGLSWQQTRGSALLGFVHDDAAYLAGLITTRAQAGQAVQPAAQRTA